MMTNKKSKFCVAILAALCGLFAVLALTTWSSGKKIVRADAIAAILPETAHTTSVDRDYVLLVTAFDLSMATANDVDGCGYVINGEKYETNTYYDSVFLRIDKKNKYAKRKFTAENIYGDAAYKDYKLIVLEIENDPMCNNDYTVNVYLTSGDTVVVIGETLSFRVKTLEKYYVRTDADGNESENGEYILFGEYPQSKVSDDDIIATLNGDAKTPLTDPAGWTSYEYYTNGDNSTDYMWYTDRELDGQRYRGVYFSSYRPEFPVFTLIGLQDSNQDDNGYFKSTVYWFRYEPVKWFILEEADGKATLLCEMIIDSREYYHQSSSHTKRNRTAIENYDGSDVTVSDSVYDSNYLYSNIRKWLNETFYETAFSNYQKNIISAKTIDNGSNYLSCAATTDRIWLLSAEEATMSWQNVSYQSDSAEGANRQKKTTDYAQCQGAYTYSGESYDGNGYWWLRTPCYIKDFPNNTIDTWGVRSNGEVFSISSVGYSDCGVVPALQITL